MTVLKWFGDAIGIGLGSHELNAGNMILRAAIVYAFAIIVLRLGDKRFLGKNTTFDVILGVIFGSVMSRAITGSSAFLATLAASSVLILFHWILAFSTYHTGRSSDFLKGVPRHLIKAGQLQTNVLRHSHISENDLLQSLRIGQGTEDLTTIDDAYLERSGDISFIPRPSTPQIIEIKVEEGVQTVRIEWQAK